MQFIKTLFWVVLAVVLVVFTANNWSPVSVLIWEDIRIDTKLPVLVIGAFLLGFFPTWLLHRTSRWRMGRRIKTLEEAARPTPVPTPSSTPKPAPVDVQKEKVQQPVQPAPAVSPIGDAETKPT